jgi:hypothetical protein
VVGTVLLGLVSGVGPGAASAEEVILLNELMADPASDWNGDGVYHSRDDEWVEVVNAGASPVSLIGYRLASPDTTWRYEFSGTLDPGQVQVVYGSQSYAWEQATGNPAYGLRLTNTGGVITLWKLSPADTVLVDSYAYADHEAEDERSSGRFPDGGAVWTLFDALNPYSGSGEPTGSGCEPSPGSAAFCPVPAREGSWGRIKGLFGPQ